MHRGHLAEKVVLRVSGSCTSSWSIEEMRQVPGFCNGKARVSPERHLGRACVWVELTRQLSVTHSSFTLHLMHHLCPSPHISVKLLSQAWRRVCHWSFALLASARLCIPSPAPSTFFFFWSSHIFRSTAHRETSEVFPRLFQPQSNRQTLVGLILLFKQHLAVLSAHNWNKLLAELKSATTVWIFLSSHVLKAELEFVLKVLLIIFYTNECFMMQTHRLYSILVYFYCHYFIYCFVSTFFFQFFQYIELPLVWNVLYK